MTDTVTPPQAEPIETHAEVVEPDRLPERAPRNLVDQAADAALAIPMVPGREEFVALAMEARMLSMSGLVPGALRGKPHDVLLILLVGRDLGIAQTSALQSVYVVDGKPSLAPKLLNRRIRGLGLGAIRPHPDNSKEWAGAVVLSPEGVRRVDDEGALAVDVKIGMSEFTWEDAQDAGLVSRNCRPGNHATGNGCRCKDNWKKYPQRMLWWRAAGYAADDFFPEASLGLYSPDELGAVTDEDGRPIDPSTVELPDGFDRGARGSHGDEHDDTLATPADLWELQERIRALPEDSKAELRKRWLGRESLAKWPAHHLPDRLMGLAKALLAGVEAGAKTTGWNPDQAIQDVRLDVATTCSGLLRLLLNFSVLPVWPETPPDASGDAAPADDAQPGPDSNPEPQEAPTWVQEIIEEVRQMGREEVDEALRLWSLPKTGNVQTRRARLAEAMVRDRQRTTDEQVRDDAASEQ